MNSQLIKRGISAATATAARNSNGYSYNLHTTSSSSSSHYSHTSQRLNQTKFKYTPSTTNTNTINTTLVSNLTNSSNTLLSSSSLLLTRQSTFAGQYESKRSIFFANPYEKYLTKIKVDTIDPKENVLVYQHDRETVFAGVKTLLIGQCAASVLFPVATLAKGLEAKYQMMGALLLAWSGTFYFMGKRLVSNLATRVYYNKAENCILLVHYYPNQQVLKIPIDQIKPSLNTPESLYILLEDNTMFMLQNTAKVNDEVLTYIMSGQEYEFKVRQRDEKEYNEMVELSREKIHDIIKSNNDLDKELEKVEKELKELKEQEEKDLKEQEEKDLKDQQQSEQKKVCMCMLFLKCNLSVSIVNEIDI
ncbi:hypothetical protein DFA_01376 [Cavenderia fasciculata]|uniref:Transmembrane protein n=1 Tax=Cavenderia fasciculata TaxID=261658 RepID=F4PSG0_CACFS|nr:uncharacterized protein DFA_01376 [Cavenderia fasciculata]EGG21490.1 hypothetical protein DFA_01376 [Cavenderia fasciculata]|eukprot:XP_004359340.1 hypothetical protein DFA_01376 [Cavenderia fasciculata]